jgi:hypothetical protein
VFQFSSLHGSGQQLNLYTGIAATLRFPMPDIAEEGAVGTGAGADSSDEDEAADALLLGRCAGYDDIADFS